MSVSILTSGLLERAGLVHGFTTRATGDVLGSLAGWERDSGLAESSLVRLNQVHGTDVLVVDRPLDQLPAGPARSFDASVTDRPGPVLGVRTADCVPVLLFCPDPRAAGVVHAGWRGTLAGAVTHAVSTLQGVFGCQPRDLLAAIGPCIQPCCYRVGDDVYQQFLDRFGSEGVSVLGQERFVHLAAVNRMWLVECGLPAEHIDVLDLCTSCRQDLFFSHRRDGGRAGRQLAYITLQGQSAGRAAGG